MKPTDPDWPTCACGCGEPVPVRKASKPELGLEKGEPCFYVANHSNRVLRKQIVDGLMHCARCDTLKPLESFGIDKTRPNGFHPTCLVCARARRRAYYRKNKARLNRQETERQRRAPERQRERMAAYRARNRERLNEDARVAASARRARIRDQFVEDVHHLVVLELDDGVCGICGEDVDPFGFDVDHIFPLSKGGEHSYANTQAAHPSCNNRKRARITI
jgi:5-methylcytosine-specific restriction endonuclease McrA